VSTNIQRDGKRISLHNLGKKASEKARKELEVQFGLTRAGEKKKNRAPAEEQSFPAQKAVYGKLPTKRAITNVLDAVLPHYKYASLPELNAVLRRYNVMADRGAEDSIVYRTGGLLYRLLDEKGTRVGVPVKASAIYSKPTLAFLEQRFKENAEQKRAYKKGLQSAIDWILVKPPQSITALEKALQKENISLVTRQNEHGFVYGLTYIDNRTRCVFNGSDLGKAYSAKGIAEKCGISQAPREEKGLQPRLAHDPEQAHTTRSAGKWNKEAALLILDGLLRGEQQEVNVPFEFRKSKKRRRRI